MDERHLLRSSCLSYLLDAPRWPGLSRSYGARWTIDINQIVSIHKQKTGKWRIMARFGEEETRSGSFKQTFSFAPVSALLATTTIAGSFCEMLAPQNFLQETFLIFAFAFFPMNA